MAGKSYNLEALAVDDGGSGFVVLGLGDPHSLESRERAARMEPEIINKRNR